MKDKIKEKLKTLMDKTSVSERTIDDLADSFSALITYESLETFDFSKVIKSLDGNINAVVAKVATAPKVEEKPKVEVPKIVESKEPENEYSKLKNEIELMKTELQNTKIAKIEAERSFKFKDNISKLPDNLKSVFEKSYSKMKFSHEDDTDFDTYLTDIQTDIIGLVQTNNLSGLNGSAPSAVVKPIVNDGQDSILASALKAVEVKADK